MDLLNENENQNKSNKSSKMKKLILALIIMSVLLMIVIMIAMVYLQSKNENVGSIIINGEIVQLNNDLIIQDSTGTQYVSIKDLVSKFGYLYDNSEYGQDGKDSTKCYVKNGNLIYGFELNSQKMFKYEEKTNIDYQYYTLKHAIITYNNKLYIALEDLGVGLNVLFGINAKNDQIINSIEYLSSYYTETLKDSGYTLSEDQNNKKALAYGWIIVKKNNLYCVLDSNYREKVSNKYSYLYFDEQNQNFIVANTDGKYGIITKEGYVQQQLIYDDLQILNYEHMLYKVKNNEKYGILRQDGSRLTPIEYDDIGFPEDKTNRILYTLIMPKVSGLDKETIIVKQGEKYGLVAVETGQLVVPCDNIDKIYATNELGEIKYYVEAEKITGLFEDYIQYLLTKTINLN